MVSSELLHHTNHHHHDVSVAIDPASEGIIGNYKKKKRRKNGNNRVGFYVSMRLHQHNKPKWFIFASKLVKWLLWPSLFIYFIFSSSFILSNNNNNDDGDGPSSSSDSAFSKPGSSHLASRALFESNLSASLHKSTHDSVSPHPSIPGDLKIYVYDLPDRYNSNWLSPDGRCERHLFAAEVAVHRALLSSPARTLDPYDADFFYVPVYVSCNFSAVNGFPAIGHARGLISDAVRLVSDKYPFWNRSKGSDHVFAATHDFGSCFHTLEDVAMADGVPSFLKNSVILQTFGVTYAHPCQDVDNVVIPPYVSPEAVSKTLKKYPLDGKRDIFAFFRGKMEIHPKNVSGRFYSKAVRTKIWNHYAGDRRFYLKRHRLPGYQSEIARSKFCLCPLGWAPWSPRLVEAVALGCVPVVIADGIRLPFSDEVRWPEISLTVAERDVGSLGRILDEVARTNLTDIQRNLRDPAVRRALMFNVPAEEGDATWQVMIALAHRLESRSQKRRGRSEGQLGDAGVYSE